MLNIARSVKRKVWKNDMQSHTRGINMGVDNLSRCDLLRLIPDDSRANDIYRIFWHLFKLKNYTTASDVADSLNLSRLPLRRKLFVIQSLISSSRGVEADLLLGELISHIRITALSDIEKSALVDRVVSSGYPVDKKLTLLRKFCGQFEQIQEFVGNEFVQYSCARVLADTDEGVHIDDLLDVKNFGERSPKFLYRVFGVLKNAGHLDFICDNIKNTPSHLAFGDLDWLKLLLSYYPQYFIGRETELANHLPGNIWDVLLLKRLFQNSSMHEELESCFNTILSKHYNDFANRDLYQKDQFLRALVEMDMESGAYELITKSSLPDTVLNADLIRANEFYCSDDYRSARVLYENILRENPGDGRAALGLRFSLPRVGRQVDAIMPIRDEIGFGAAGFGRPGAFSSKSYLNAETVISLLMKGDYVAGYYQKRQAGHWRFLKFKFPSKFYNYAKLPTDGSLFVIADDGVGDEIRSAQFYSALTSLFKKVVITCDPRLLVLLQTAFPSITFIPVRRYRSGVKDPEPGMNRLSGWGIKLYSYLTTEAAYHLSKTDHITFGQNLFFNHFIGHLDRPQPGAYLQAPRNVVKRKSNPDYTSKLKVGLLWRSHLSKGGRRLMYLKIDELVSLFAIEGVEFWSLQHDITEEESRYCREHGVSLIEDIDLFNDFEGLSERLVDFDLLIGISSVPIELGASLGVPVWLLGYSPENYYLRTKGGQTERDHLTLNSTVIAPKWIDFTAARKECVELVIDEAKVRLESWISGIDPNGFRK